MCTLQRTWQDWVLTLWFGLLAGACAIMGDMKRLLPISAAALGLIAVAGCAGGTMFKKGEAARPLVDAAGQPARGLDGQPLSLEQLRKEGPVMLVFLRGFS
jgi:hypothetical protein